MVADETPMGLPDWKIVGSMANAERAALINALVTCDYNVTETARMLRIGRSTIYRLIDILEVPLRQRVDGKPAVDGQRKQTRRKDGAGAGGGPRVVFENGAYFLR